MKNNLIKYGLVMALIQVSGNPGVEALGQERMVVGFFLLVALLSLTQGVKLPKKAIPLMVVFTFILLAHVVIFGGSVSVASAGFFVQLLTAMLLMGMIPDFLRYFVRCMFALALLSLPFYFLVQLPGLDSVFAPYDMAPETRGKTVLGIHTFFHDYGASGNRNSGLMWEPGAFAGYLALALFFCAIVGRELRISVIETLVLIVALGTTLSTMGYIAFAVVATTYLYRKTSGRNAILFLTAFPIALVIFGVVAVNVGDQFEFLTEKIVRQANEVEEDREKAERNRFGNALYDLEFVAARPIFGWSANTETRVELDNLALEKTKGQGNALTGFAVRFGLLGWFTVMVFFFLGFKTASRSIIIGLAGVLLVFVLLSSEKYLNFPLLMTAMFLTPRHIKSLGRRRRRRRLSGKSQVLKPVITA